MQKGSHTDKMKGTIISKKSKGNLLCSHDKSVFSPAYLRSRGPLPLHYRFNFDVGLEVEPMTLMWSQAPPKLCIPPTPSIQTGENTVSHIINFVASDHTYNERGCVCYVQSKQVCELLTTAQCQDER